MFKYKLILSVFFIFSILFSSAQNHQQSGTVQADEKLIDSQVNRIVSDWNTHEFKNMDLYATEDVDWVNLVGMWWKGRADVVKAHQITFDHFFKGVPFTKRSSTIRLLTKDAAIVHLLCHVGSLFPPDGIDHGNNATPETDNLLTLIFVKKNGGWLLSSGQNTLIDERAAKSNPVPGKTSENIK